MIMEVCKMNFHTVMLLQCKVCTLMAPMGRGKEYLLIVLVVPRDGHLTSGVFFAEGSFVVKKC